MHHSVKATPHEQESETRPLPKNFTLRLTKNIHTSSNIFINKPFVLLTITVTFRLILRFFSKTNIPLQIKENGPFKTDPENIICDGSFQE